MTVSLSPEAQHRLEELATRRDLKPADLARQLIEEHLPLSADAHPNAATRSLLEQWEREDQTNNQDELNRRQREGDELIANLAKNRLEMEGPNSRKLRP